MYGRCQQRVWEILIPQPHINLERALQASVSAGACPRRITAGYKKLVCMFWSESVPDLLEIVHALTVPFSCSFNAHKARIEAIMLAAQLIM